MRLNLLIADSERGSVSLPALHIGLFSARSIKLCALGGKFLSHALVHNAVCAYALPSHRFELPWADCDAARRAA